MNCRSAGTCCCGGAGAGVSWMSPSGNVRVHSFAAARSSWIRASRPSRVTDFTRQNPPPSGRARRGCSSPTRRRGPGDQSGLAGQAADSRRGFPRVHRTPVIEPHSSSVKAHRLPGLSTILKKTSGHMRKVVRKRRRAGQLTVGKTEDVDALLQDQEHRSLEDGDALEPLGGHQLQGCRGFDDRSGALTRKTLPWEGSPMMACSSSLCPSSRPHHAESRRKFVQIWRGPPSERLSQNTSRRRPSLPPRLDGETRSATSAFRAAGGRTTGAVETASASRSPGEPDQWPPAD